ncbi:ABC transporter ATP-binding protein [Metabacillus halosaccharovorans]|uniref:ABC transporter ATP-binding protein/permease n=1 Tax=Metabacillus halosaccharovorans TaxID=930124 RepID=A0ABT3DIY5_9BACI|nr:ABC transporter ATP-binding protein [Metabacillus halosaccharovorans]MCV9886967.1 ABC transporter ATP-binding protein/permease [Metabacillus halosaccharovorans]
MNIANMSDRQLLGRMLGFAKPYWKRITLSIFITGLIVIATLAQPYIIKVAIDTYINGIYSPMVVVSQDETDDMKNKLNHLDMKFQETASLEEKVYIRLPDSKSEQEIEDLEKAAIVSIENTHYLVQGWNEGLSKAEEYQLHSSTNQIEIDGNIFPVNHLSQAEMNQFRDQDYTGLLILGAIYFILIASSAVLTFYQQNTLQYTGQSIIYDIRETIFKHLSKMSISFYGKHPIGRLVTRITHDVEALNQLYSQVIVNLIKEILILLGIILIMLHLSVKLTLVSLIVIPAVMITTIYFKTVMRKAQRKIRLILSKLNSFLAENLSGMSIIQLFVREEKQLEQFNELNERHYKAGMRQTILNSIFNPSIGFFGNLSLALLVWFGGRNVLEGAITFGIVYAFTHYVRQFFEPLRALADQFNQIQSALASAERIFETLDTKSTILNPHNPKKLGSDIKGEIRFDHVSFAYKNEEWVLKDIHFHIQPGETVGIVGETGAGKSSIIQLINRFYDIQKGKICLDNVNIKDVQLSELRKHIGIIQQDSFVFSGTVFDNIRLNQQDITNEDIIKMAKSVNIDAFFRTLPNQYETVLGEQGTVLSTGQNQLLSFLRAIIANPKVLILDEATANIDTETEAVVQKTLRKISENRTTIIIAHRLSTIQHADKIIVLNKGKIVEMGNHQELLKSRNMYYQLCKSQSKANRSRVRV